MDPVITDISSAVPKIKETTKSSDAYTEKVVESGVPVLDYEEAGKGVLKTKKFNFKKNDDEVIKEGPKYDYDQKRLDKLVPTPLKKRNCKYSNIRVTEKEKVLGQVKSAQDGTKGYNTVIGSIVVDVAAPIMKETKESKFRLETKTMKEVAKKSRYGMQEVINDTIPPLNDGYVAIPQGVTTLKMGEGGMNQLLTRIQTDGYNLTAGQRTMASGMSIG